VQIVADSRLYTAGLEQATKKTKLFGAETEAMSAKVGVGFKNLGRSLAFASGGFVAFAGATELLKTSVDAARDAGVAQRSLAAQMKASGQSFEASKAGIDKAGLALEKFGFTSEDSAHALTVLERGTGSITRSIQLQGVAANLARAKNIDLASAANVLAKVFGGQETALRRAVPGLAKHEHGLDLIYDAQRRLAGQAAAGTTAAERFSATMHDTEVIIGTALLPVMNKFLGELGDWLEKMNRSGQLQRDVNSAVKTATGLFQDLKGIVEPLVGVFKDFSGAVGGTRQALKLLIEVFAGLKFASWAGGFARVGGAAEGATGKVGGLRRALGLLPSGPIGIAIDVAIATEFAKSYFGGTGKHLPGWLAHPPGYSLPATTGLTPLLTAFSAAPNSSFSGAAADKLAKLGMSQAMEFWLEQHPGAWTNMVHGVDLAATPAGKAILKGIRDRTVYTVTEPPGYGKTGGPGGPRSIKGLPGTVAGRAIGDYTPEQKIQMALAGDPNNVSLLRQQAAYDRQQIAFLRRLKAQGRGPGAKQSAAEIESFKSDLTSTLGTIASINSSLKKDVAKAAKKAGEFTLPTRLVNAAAKASVTASTADDAKVARETKAFAQQMIDSGKVKGQAIGDAWNAIRDANNTILADAQAQEAALKEQRKKARELIARLLGRQRPSLEEITARAERPGPYERLGPLRLHSYTEPLQFQLAIAKATATGDSKGLLAALLGARKAAYRALNSGKQAGDAQRDAWNEIGSLNDQLKQQTTGDMTYFKHLSSTRFVDSLGLNLTLAQRRAIESRFSQVGPGGAAPTGTSNQFTAGITINGPMHFHGVQDVAGLEDQLMKRANARGHVRRGAR
jgi:hypothetical protein